MYFDSEAHKERFNELCAVYAGKSREFKRLFYILSCDFMYKKINNCYDFENSCIKLEALEASWQSNGSKILTLSAFSLFNGNDIFNVNLRDVVNILDDKNRNVLITALTI